MDKPGTFAAAPEASGMYYQWNRKKGWPAEKPGMEWYNASTSGEHWEAENDPCPKGWRVPTAEEMKTLLTSGEVASIYTQRNGVEGVEFTDMSTRASVFFPFANTLSYQGPSPIGRVGIYWSASSSGNRFAECLELSGFNQVIELSSSIKNEYGHSVRCVADEKIDSIVSHDTVTICSTDLPYEWRDTIFGKGTETGTYRISRRSCAYTDIAYLHLTVQEENEKSCPGVLINGVCWAEYNVDEPGRFANPGKPYGMLYQWNRKKGWPAMTPESVSGWDSSLEPGNTWEPANDPCPAGWRLPTFEEIKSLTDKAKVTYTEQVGQDGALGTRYTDIATGNMLFLPITGYRDAQGTRKNVLWIHYWSSTDYWSLNRNSTVQEPYAKGYSVRCVADENAYDIVLTASETVCKEALPYTWHDTTFREGTVTGEYCIRRSNSESRCDTVFYLYLTVDTLCGKPCKERGVFINGVCWAESNVDNPNTFADTPEAFGLLYQWNRKKGYSLKENIDPDDWKLYDSYVRWEAANNPCPADWRIPTIGEIYTLLDDLKVTREWGQQNGVYGLRLTDKLNGNIVFFPAAGARSDPRLQPSIEDDECGFYWSTTKEYNDKAVWNFSFFWNKEWVYAVPLTNGAFSVRCVAGRDTTGCITAVTNTSLTVCVNDLPYEWGDTTFGIGTESGVYHFQHISAVTGCDSIVNLHLTVHASDTSFFDFVCYGDDYNDYGFHLPAVYRDTVIHDTLQSVWGCDSVRTLHLTVNPEYHTSLYDTVCQGTSYNRHGFSLPDVQTDRVHTLSLSSRAGCDSTLTLHLKVHPVYGTTLYDTICQGDDYTNHGFNLPAGTAGGTFTETYSTVHGCDSVVTLHLHVHPSHFFSETQHICQGDTITFHDRQLYKSGVYYDSLTTVHGCDSIYSMTLAVHPVYVFSFSGAVCQGNGYHEYGFNLPAVYGDTIVRDTFKTRWGCDSTLTLHLKVHPVYATTLYDTICQGDDYTNHGFSLPAGTLGGTFTETYSTVYGCDSVVTLHLHVHPSHFFSETQHICQGDTITFHDRQLYKSGVYYDSLTTIHGCDSIYSMTLTVHSTSPLLIPDAVCSGSSYHNHGFHLPAVYHDTIVRDTFRSVWGCDSIRILSLSVHPVYETSLYDTICQGDDYNRRGFSLSNVQTDAVYTLSLSSRAGCDSTLILHLKIHPVYDTTLYDSICPSAHYERYGFRLSNLHESGTYRRTLPTVHGCDSTVTLHLHVWPTYFNPETVHLCEGDTFDFRGRRYHESGVYYDSLSTVRGCDSIYCLYLSIHPVYDLHLSGVLCEGSPYTQNGFHATTPGTHYRYLQSTFGCDSTITLTLTEEKKITGAISLLLEDCSLHGYSFFFEPGDQISQYQWDLGDGTILRTEEGYHQYADSGTYRIQLHTETYNDCENHFTYIQYVPPYLKDVPIHSDRQVIDEDYPTVRFHAVVLPGMTCRWDFGDGVTATGDSVSHTYNATTEPYYDVRLQILNSDSCVTESGLRIEVVFLPKTTNTFSPNGDGINDIFMPDYRIEIIDRNGLRIFTGESGWDGTYNGRQAKEDTYFYRLHYRTANGERQKTGYVTLIR